MRIAYVGRWGEEPSDGVGGKVAAHVRAWQGSGHEVRAFRLPLVGYARPGERHGGARAVPGSVLATVRMRRAVTAFDPDVLYVRYGLYVPGLRRLQGRFPSVVELNANNRAEAARMGGGPRRALNEAAWRSLLAGAAGIVCVAHEIARAAAPAGRPLRVIANGIDLDEVRPLPPSTGHRPLLAFLAGTPQPWHGVDKILALAAAMPDCDVALVGVDAAALPAPAPANVEVHAPTSRDGYAQILARADAGIGSLAMHRAGLGEGSPLKVREYLAHGLPVVLGFEDTDFLGANPWYLLRLPNTEHNVTGGVDRIRAFVERVRGRRVAREEIAPAIGAQAKEAERLAFMREVARGRAR